jgi:hypothetical protein
VAALSLSDLKAFLNKTDDSDDDELVAMIDRAQAILTPRIGPLEPTTYTELYTGPGPIVLRRYPVLSVTSVTDGGNVVSDSYLDVDSGVLYGTYSSWPARSVSVTYVAGRDLLPADLETALLELVRHLWTSQRGGGSLRPTFPGEDAPQQQPGSGYLLPYRVESLIEPYRLRSSPDGHLCDPGRDRWLLAALRGARWPGRGGRVRRPADHRRAPTTSVSAMTRLDPLNAVEASQSPASLGNRAREESYDILCSLASWSGGDT